MKLSSWLNSIRRSFVRTRRRTSLSPIRQVEALEDRTLLSNLTLVDAYLEDGQSTEITSPVLGEQLGVRAEFEYEDLSEEAEYRLDFSIDGVTLSSFDIKTGSGEASGTASWFRTGWYATSGEHTVVVTVDGGDTVAESDETDNSFSFQFTPISGSPPSKLIWPVEAAPFTEVYISNYVDMDPTDGESDYTGGNATYDGHNAWDIGTGTFHEMDLGVELYAAADGTVTAIHDGEFDRHTEWVTPTPSANYVKIDHGDGWQTVYWHLRRDSLQVEVGQAVQAGDFIAYMGSSGNSSASHLHFALRHHGRTVETAIDPDTYYQDPLRYVGDDATVYRSGVTNYSPSSHSKERPSDVEIFKQASGHVTYAWARFAGLRDGDSLQYVWKRPDGTTHTTGTRAITQDYSNSHWWFSRTLPTTPDLGTWTVEFTVNGTKIGEDSFEVTAEGAPEILVEDDGEIVLDERYTPVDLGTVNLNAISPTRTFTVTNHGGDTLTLGTPTVPAGFSITEELDTSLAPDASDTFTVSMATDTGGYFAGQVRFTSNDADESTYNFSIEGTVETILSETLVLGISERHANEGESLFANVRRLGSTTNPLTVTLTSSDPVEISLPATVTIPAGEERASFVIQAVSDNKIDPDRITSVTATAPGHATAQNTLLVHHVGSFFQLATLNGNNGFRLDGIDESDHAGYSVSTAGDFNGDGYADILVGASSADPGGNSNAGETYVVFGSGDGFAASLDLDTLDGSNGFRLDGVDTHDHTGRSVSTAGDINGDGYADIVMGTDNWTVPANAQKTYVVLGSGSGFAASLDLATLDGSNGFRLDGAGPTVSTAGDVNGDGFDDILVAAQNAKVGDNNGAGQTYVFFGSESGFAPILDLSTLNGSNGFRLDGIDAKDNSGWSVNTAGDVNGDGYDDILVGARHANPGGDTRAGETYVVLGSGDGFAASLDLSALDGNNGFRLDGIDAEDLSGTSVSTAGDVNGDGFADILVGAWGAWGPGLMAGEAYVVFGSGSGFEASLDLATLDGSNGFRLDNIDGWNAGFAVSTAGDLNSDGFADILVAKGTNVVFGSGDAFAASLNLPTLDGSNGFRIYGIDVGDNSGWSVSNAGDVNGDGYDDILVGARDADPGGDSNAGETYVVFGGDFTGTVTHPGTSAAETLTGDATANVMVAGLGDDIVIGGGGEDVIHAAAGDDTIRISDTTFAQLDGGSGADTLALVGSGLTLDLTTTADSALTGIETIDLSGSGNNTLVLDLLEVLNISDTSNTLTVTGDQDDWIDIGPGWTKHASTGGKQHLTQRSATLRISMDVSTSAPLAIPLDLLEGGNGFRLDGIDAGDRSGSSVSKAGDVNGDGYADFLVGAWGADPGGDSDSGETYVVFGSGSEFAASLDLSTLDGSNGFRLDGVDAGDHAGSPVSTAGDINGDGYADILVGAFWADLGGNSNSGATYVVFGSGNAFAASLDLSTLDGSNGFRLDGIDENDHSRGVGTAGDINGDGYADIMVVAEGADSEGDITRGEMYVVFGSGSGFAASLDLSTLDGSNGFHVNGLETESHNTWSVDTAGDVDGDGYADILMGITSAGIPDPFNQTVDEEGGTYVVLGSGGGFPASLDLSTLDGTNGFRLQRTFIDDSSSFTANPAGDVNGDGYSDILVGAPSADAGGNTNAGETYVVFGSGSGFAAILELSTLDGSNGFRLNGIDENDYSSGVGTAGDMNGDGYADILVSADRDNTGETYVIFGSGSGFAASLDLDTLDGTNGFRLDGIDPDDYSGKSSTGGDINGDGFDDILVGASGADPSGKQGAGETYVVFGGNFTGAITHAGTSAAETLTGDTAANVMMADQGDDTVIGGGGEDVIHAATGDDTIRISDTTFARIDGGSGTDTLALDGSGITLDLTAIANNKVTAIETIDLSGSGNNTLVLDVLEVLNLSDTSNSLTVTGDPSDVVYVDPNWEIGTSASIGDTTYRHFTQGAAKLLVEIDVRLGLALPDGSGPWTISMDASDLLVTDGSDTLRLPAATTPELLVRGTNDADSIVVGPLVSEFSGSLLLHLQGGDDVVDASTSDIAIKVNGDGGNDNLVGGSSNDTLNGGSGSDSLAGGPGNDKLQGQGNSLDSLSGGPGDDTLDGGNGYDRISETADVDFTATDSSLTGLGNDTLINIQLVQLFGGSSANTIDASAFTGRAFLNGSGGNDTLTGGGWYDRIFGGSGRDLITGGTSVIDPGTGLSTYDVLRGQGGNYDTLIGGDGADKLNGGAGHDSLVGGGGDDVLTGESGNDTLDGGDGSDRLYERANVDMTLTDAHLSGGLGIDDVTSIETAYLKGGNSDNRLDASAFSGDVTIIGVGGSDTLKGGDGNDMINGRSGADSITGGDGDDTLMGMRDTDTLNGGAGNDWIDGGTQNDSISGWTGDDTLYGRSGNDIIVGGEGHDTLYGATGDDILQGDDGKVDTSHSRDNDRLDGGTDDDTVRGGGGSDTMMDDASEVDESFAYWAEWVDAV